MTKRMTDERLAELEARCKAFHAKWAMELLQALKAERERADGLALTKGSLLYALKSRDTDMADLSNQFDELKATIQQVRELPRYPAQVVIDKGIIRFEDVILANELEAIINADKEN